MDFILKIPGHPTEFGYEDRTLRVFGALPQAGVGSDTGILVVSLGKANPPENPFYIKLRQALANLFDVVCIGVEILGTNAMRNKKLELQIRDDKIFVSFLAHSVRVEALKKCQKGNSLSIPALLQELRGRDLFEHILMKENLPQGGPHDYLDFGVTQAMDVLHAVFAVKTKFNCSDERIFMIGSSLGGFLTHMVRRFAPQTFAWILDISGPAIIHENYFIRKRIFRGIYGTDNTIIGVMNDNIYSDDENHPYFYSPDMAYIRSLIEESLIEQEMAEEQAMTIVTGSEDKIAALIQKKFQAKLLRRAGAKVDLIVVTPREVDRDILRHAGHSLGADFYKLIRAVGERPLRECRNNRASDFESASVYHYNTPGGAYRVDFGQGPPRLTFSNSLDALSEIPIAQKALAGFSHC